MRLNDAVIRKYLTAKRQRKLRMKGMPNAKRRIQLPNAKEADPVEDERSQTEVEKEVIRAFRVLLNGFEEQWRYAATRECE